MINNLTETYNKNLRPYIEGLFDLSNPIPTENQVFLETRKYLSGAQFCSYMSINLEINHEAIIKHVLDNPRGQVAHALCIFELELEIHLRRQMDHFEIALQDYMKKKGLPGPDFILNLSNYEKNVLINPNKVFENIPTKRNVIFAKPAARPG